MLDEVIKVGREVCSTGEEESLKVVQSYVDLSRKLWRLEGLPLSITSVQGSHLALRYTQLDYSFFDREKLSRSLVPQEGKPCPVYITSVKVICHMEGSRKWPHDQEAIRHIKAAFHISLGELLTKHHRYTCQPSPTHLDVWKAPATPPVLRGAGPLHSSRVSSGGFPSLPSTGETTPWWSTSTASSPLLTSQRSRMSSSSPESLCLSCSSPTPKDKKLSICTNQAPSVQMLQGVVMVAAESLKVLEPQLMDANQIQDVRVAMRPPLDAYDVLTHLIPKQVPLLSQAVDPPHATFSRGILAGSVANTGGVLPVIDFCPVTHYLAELRDAFGVLALFFCDPYGGTVIAVLWKPKAFSPLPFKTSQMVARHVEVSGEEAHTVPNVEAILEDFRVMGQGLVKSVEPWTEKWVV
ncbi:hypothetical protein J4Q44_G00236430 [Coregonus suidteri]|uniref:Nucleolar protein 6 n=1 Tax=Coregonus suidteri TaxID=861788 RepID=A0AAN8L7T7_9TELE